MPERTVDIVIGEGSAHVSEKDKLHALLVARAAEAAPRIVDILDRGMVVDRLKVDLPSDLHGEWVPNDKLEIARYEAMGFVIDTAYAPSRSLHSDGTGKAIIGDTIHMICHKSVREAIDKIRKRAFDASHGVKSKQAEETEYLKTAAPLVADGIVPTAESKAHAIDDRDIVAALGDNKLG